MIKRIFTALFLLTLLCCLTVTVHAETNIQTVSEAMDIILDHHGVVTDMDVADYLTLDAEEMTREAAVTAVVRSFGVYPADEADYVWADEGAQGEQYRPYIDYARRMGITVGVGENQFAPKQLVTEWELRTMLDRAEGVQPEYPLVYDASVYQLLSAETQRGLSLVPDFLVDRFYQEGRVIHAAGHPIVMPNGSHLSSQYAGLIQFDGDVWLSVEVGNAPYWYQYEAAIHELGHYLGYRTALLDRNQVPEERDWLIRRYRPYCNENNHEFFADSFTAYILWPAELQENAPTVYAHIEACLHEMEGRM